jgi:acyl carrier protein
VSSTQEIQSGLAEILEEVAGVTPADATPEKSFTDDLDVDSLSMVEIATAVEDKFGVAIPDDELANIKTVGDAISFIEKNQYGTPAPAARTPAAGPCRGHSRPSGRSPGGIP